ncbi:hypothetical protein BD324DRAFT_616435 [Kockovaella imperatae]|uniref:Phytanoyl-CoA dioxygenase n=1 Tax=Kockovaella imperatae TaxID=4999 RepID=A0A1Y1UPY8_9TREE|nr:hypothetical protein BD324DRAFT_616435 [Kockovaella imperatae]ORX40130.1 hypothetical protein BD324DRAFT_616435 [Kockovaella imperatae]
MAHEHPTNGVNGNGHVASDIASTFQRQGYYFAKGVFSPEELADLEVDFDRIVQQISSANEDINATWTGPEMKRLGGNDKVVLHTHNVQQYSAHWMKAFYHPKFLQVSKAILGEDIVLHHSKLFQKPSEKGAPFPMHQDWTYFPTIKDSMIAAIIHVSEATDEMGCLRVIPGSNEIGRMSNTSGQDQNDYLAAHPIESATPLPAQPGDVLFFHYFTLHGSMPNRSDKIRKTVLLQMYSGDDEVEAGNPHPNERLVLSGFNSKATRSIVNSH